MSERVKFDDDASAKGKIATSPDITVDAEEMKKQHVAEPDGHSVNMCSEPVQILSDDTAADARYSRMMGRLAARVGKIDSEFAKELTEWGQDFIFPTLRDMCRQRPPLFRLLTGFTITVPAIFFAMKASFNASRKEGEEDAAGIS